MFSDRNFWNFFVSPFCLEKQSPGGLLHKIGSQKFGKNSQNFANIFLKCIFVKHLLTVISVLNTFQQLYLELVDSTAQNLSFPWKISLENVSKSVWNMIWVRNVIPLEKMLQGFEQISIVKTTLLAR